MQEICMHAHACGLRCRGLTGGFQTSLRLWAQPAEYSQRDLLLVVLGGVRGLGCVGHPSGRSGDPFSEHLLVDDSAQGGRIGRLQEVEVEPRR